MDHYPDCEKMKSENLQLSQISQKCPECGSIHIMRDQESAEIVCMECGFVVVAEITNQGPEWRAFDSEQQSKLERVGTPSTFAIHDKGLSTMIDWHDRDINGQKFPQSQRAQIYRIRKWNRRIRISNAYEKNLAFALAEMSKIANNLNLPRNVLETASIIYRKVAKSGGVRGRPIQGISAAAIYVACRQCGLPRTLEDVSQASPTDKKNLGRYYRFILKKLNYFVPQVETSQYISKFSNQLTMEGNAEEIAHKIFVVAKEIKLTSGRGPTGMAAAASYVASILFGERRTQREIAEIAQVTEVTIRNRYKELTKLLQFKIYL